MIVSGKVWKYGDDVNTDVIFPGKYTYSVTDLKEMGKYALEDLDEDFQKNAQPGDIIVAGKNWGCGSSREQAVKCLKSRGIGAIVAGSFSRIYFRNAINNGIPVIQCPEVVKYVEKGEEIRIDLTKGVVYAGKNEFTFAPAPDFLQGIIQDGGMIPHLQKVNHWKAQEE